jgi:hypothetical protein
MGVRGAVASAWAVAVLGSCHSAFGDTARSPLELDLEHALSPPATVPAAIPGLTIFGFAYEDSLFVRDQPMELRVGDVRLLIAPARLNGRAYGLKALGRF